MIYEPPPLRREARRCGGTNSTKEEPIEKRGMKMKRKFAFIIAAALLLTAFAMPTSCPIVAGATSEVDQARQVGQAYLECSITIFPDWDRSVVGEAQTYHDLQGGVNAYLFPIQRAGETIGRIVVGGSAYKFAVFEAGSGLPPSLPSPADVAASLNKDLGIKADVAAIGIHRLTYLGYGRYFASYEVAGDSVALDLRSRQAYPVADLTNSMTPSSEYQWLTGNRVLTLDSLSAQLPVPVQNMGTRPNPPYYNNCGPTAGAEIAEFYKYYWSYDRLDSWSADHDRLYVTMQTNGSWWYNGTLPSNWGPGFVTYAGEYPRSYSFGTFWIQSPYASDFTAIRNYVDSFRPLAALFWGYPLKSPPYPPKYTWHYVAVRGYQIDDYGNQFMIVNDGWGGIDTVSWDINYGALSLHFVYPS